MALIQILINMVFGYLFGKLIEIAIRDFRTFGWRIPDKSEMISKKKKHL